MQLSTRQITAFQKKILSWYEAYQRDLPWRTSRDPYRILVSEVMLQQTQVSRVIPKFHAWIHAFPTLKELAHAPVSDVLRLWSGLGYNRRALYLKKAAETIMKNYNGVFPHDEKTLKTLPGIGDYTARAVLCFAFNQQVTVIDTNIRKVIAHEFFGGQVPEPQTLQLTVQQLLPIGKAYEWNQALMDYTALQLQDKKIPLVKQSPFVGSNRYFRGQTIKYLLERQTRTVAELSSLLQIDRKKYEILLAALVKEGMITWKEETVALT